MSNVSNSGMLFFIYNSKLSSSQAQSYGEKDKDIIKYRCNTCKERNVCKAAELYLCIHQSKLDTRSSPDKANYVKISNVGAKTHNVGIIKRKDIIGFQTTYNPCEVVEIKC